MAIGRFAGRREDDRLLTGQGRYTADWNLPGQLYGHFRRSDRAHAEILSLEVDQALALPGVVKILTGEETKELQTPPPWVKLAGKGGTELRVPHREVLARARVRFVGQTIALVVAESAQAAQDAADLIEIEYRELQAVAEAFASAAHVTRLTLDSTRVAGNPMEPKACLAAYDAAAETWDLYSSSQGMSMMLPPLAAIFGVAEGKIRLHANREHSVHSEDRGVPAIWSPTFSGRATRRHPAIPSST